MNRPCVGGHVILRNVKCGSKNLQCGRACNAPLPCGQHRCTKRCHLPPCVNDNTPGVSCGNACGNLLSCGHSCQKPCHPNEPCQAECRQLKKVATNHQPVSFTFYRSIACADGTSLNTNAQELPNFLPYPVTQPVYQHSIKNV